MSFCIPVLRSHSIRANKIRNLDRVQAAPRTIPKQLCEKYIALWYWMHLFETPTRKSSSGPDKNKLRAMFIFNYNHYLIIITVSFISLPKMSFEKKVILLTYEKWQLMNVRPIKEYVWFILVAEKLMVWIYIVNF